MGAVGRQQLVGVGAVEEAQDLLALAVHVDDGVGGAEGAQGVLGVLGEAAHAALDDAARAVAVEHLLEDGGVALGEGLLAVLGQELAARQAVAWPK